MTDKIGLKLKSLRKAKKLTQQDVATALGISRATLSNYEICRRNPNMNDLQRLAAYYGVGLDYFGISETDTIFDLLARAKNVFEDESIDASKKDEVYKALMRLYLDMK